MPPRICGRVRVKGQSKQKSAAKHELAATPP